MNTRYSDEIDDDQATGEREITLNAATILGIFFLLAVICAVFFGFGYTMGRKSAPSPTAETLAEPAPAPVTTTSASKPTPGSRVVQSRAPEDAAASSASQPDDAQVAQPAAPPTQTSAPPQQITIPIAKPAPSRHAAATSQPPAPRAVAAPTAPPAATFMVQIAAVSHAEDAEVLQSALQRRGYHITITHVPSDKLMHVQVGPFANRKDAEAMRQKLLDDGYNAIVK